MNTRAIYAACLFAALNLCSLSARAESNVQAHTYTYGTHLDIQKVLSLSEDAAPACGVVNAHMTYLDSAGHHQALDYRKLADNCNDGN
ncbi:MULTISPECIES: DUF2790 domain-containing protein [Pseudomonas]|uniref:DUF2790 domain-containing protein n=1 Tax=Pseudomonas TaxID=286 RepID=UPI001BE51C72|nr:MULTISPECIES: DUF2790 domain-containing protein [Pseudomonas]MBT2341595.1 DUF2790 domain-containing protein [Pseudomonas fluorescens]MCD4531064.1 DUF2790 domain-containing protein [Pseudomonas sp. C3-2018]